jgi:hypothetical protein
VIIHPTLTARGYDDRHAMHASRRESIIVRMSTVPLSAIGNPPNRDHPQNSGSGADVIAMRMGENEQIDARDSGAPQVRDQDPFRAALRG